MNIPWRWIFSLWRPHRRLLLPLVVLTLLNGLAVAAVPLAIRQIFDTLTQTFTDETLKHSIGVLLAVGVARFLIYTSLQNCRAYVNCRLDWSIRSRMFKHLLTLGPGFFTRFAAGDLVTRLTDDISDDMKLSWFLCSGLFRTLEAVAVVVVVVIAMLHLNGLLTAWCLVPLPLIMLAFMTVSQRLTDRFARRQTAISAVNSEIEATLTGIHLVKSYGSETVRQASFHQVSQNRRVAEMDAVRWQALVEGIYGYAWQITAGMVLLMGGRMVIAHHISLGDFVAFNGLALSLTFPMFDFGQFMTGGRQSLVYIERLRALEAHAPEVTAASGPAGDATGPAYAADAVTFRYTPEAPTALHDINLRLSPGGMLAVVGRVGQGKSTLLRLLLRLMDPTEGRLHRDGRPLTGMSLDEVRDGVGYVPQDPVLLSETMRENIRFGRPAIADAAIERAVELAQLKGDLSGFADGLDTAVGPRGLQLSGGQKQRVSLARALAGDPSVLLLDDCTASLDAATEARLWDALRRERPELTVVVVTHRTAELEKADDILVLGDGGAVVARGRHPELMAQDGEYRQLYQRYQVREES